MESEIVRRRKLWYAAWLGGALWVARVSLIPGHVRDPRLNGVSGVGPFYALISWGYGAGARPVSIIFDFAAGAVTGSITTDGEASEAEIPLGAAPSGPYTITVSATYRILGMARTRVTQVQGVATMSVA
jgi:hypothetical protein